jgi:hypothetical protein
MDNEFKHMSDMEILRMAERERAEVIATFFRKLFAAREKESLFPGNMLPID